MLILDDIVGCLVEDGCIDCAQIDHKDCVGKDLHDVDCRKCVKRAIKEFVHAQLIKEEFRQ